MARVTTRPVNFEALPEPENFTLECARIVYEPSVYGGDGTERRKNIVFAISPSAVARVEKMETLIETDRLCPCLKGDALKCKLNLDKTDVYDIDRKKIDFPEELRGRAVNALVSVKGKWHTKTQTGYTIDVVAIQLLDEPLRECPFPLVPGPSPKFLAAS